QSQQSSQGTLFHGAISQNSPGVELSCINLMPAILHRNPNRLFTYQAITYQETRDWRSRFNAHWEFRNSRGFIWVLAPIAQSSDPNEWSYVFSLGGGVNKLSLLVGCTDNHATQRQYEAPGFRGLPPRRLRGATRHLHGVHTIKVKRAPSHADVM